MDIKTLACAKYLNSESTKYIVDVSGYYGNAMKLSLFITVSHLVQRTEIKTQSEFPVLFTIKKHGDMRNVLALH